MNVEANAERTAKDLPSVYNLMIHLLSEQGLLTVVVDDDRDAQMSVLIAGIKSGLNDAIHFILAEAA